MKYISPNNNPRRREVERVEGADIIFVTGDALDLDSWTDSGLNLQLFHPLACNSPREIGPSDNGNFSRIDRSNWSRTMAPTSLFLTS
jgi:hypothetical protein